MLGVRTVYVCTAASVRTTHSALHRTRRLRFFAHSLPAAGGAALETEVGKLSSTAKYFKILIFQLNYKSTTLHKSINQPLQLLALLGSSLMGAMFVL